MANPLGFRFRIGHRIKKMRERIDKITAERKDGIEWVALARKKMDGNLVKPGRMMCCRRNTTYGDPDIKKIRERKLDLWRT